jgi:hypothetical protein
LHGLCLLAATKIDQLLPVLHVEGLLLRLFLQPSKVYLFLLQPLLGNAGVSDAEVMHYLGKVDLVIGDDVKSLSVVIVEKSGCSKDC